MSTTSFVRIARLALVAAASLAAVSAVALASPQDARAATLVPAHTTPVLRDWYRNSVNLDRYTACNYFLTNPRVWGLTANPAAEVVGWRPIAWSASTGSLAGSAQFGWASETSAWLPLWYNDYDFPTQAGMIQVPKGRTYKLGFQLYTSGGDWQYPQDWWLYIVTC